MHIVTCIPKYAESFITVTAEKATKHIVDNITRNRPQSGTFIVSSSAFRYLEMYKIIEERFVSLVRHHNINFDAIN
jgi:hypothetical protein